jgi:transcriptional regulator with GAF, ATPase, and Fis domain
MDRVVVAAGTWRTIHAHHVIDITDRVLFEQQESLLETQNEYLREEIKLTHPFDEILGQSSALNSVLDQVHLVALTDSRVLILGETGTGE